MIREKRTLNARAVYALHGIHRWCITGTPLQNRIGDISSLLQFLRVYPYDEPTMFEAEIIQPWKSGINQEPFHRLRLLMKMIALHRSKRVINLPPRSEEVKEVAFSSEELSVYERAREGTIRILDLALDSGPATGSVYLNAFQRINDLRFICNHGVRHRGQNNQSAKGSQETDSESHIEDLDHLLDISDQACLICGTDIGDDREGSQHNLDAFQSDSLRWCTLCLRKRTKAVGEQLSTSPLQCDVMESDKFEAELPSKIKAIVSHLRVIPMEDKWYVHQRFQLSSCASSANVNNAQCYFFLLDFHIEYHAARVGG
jgi:SNF2 family DNA or RNA helicase